MLNTGIHSLEVAKYDASKQSDALEDIQILAA
jgi:hypothetical protein